MNAVSLFLTYRHSLDSNVRTMLFDHFITFIYTIIYIILGIKLAGVNIELVIIILCYLAVFALEGMSLLLSHRRNNVINVE